LIETIAEAFYESLRHDLPDAMAYKAGGKYIPISHKEIQARVERLALALRGLGLEAGDRVAILSENRPEWAMADYACAILGLVSAPVYSTLHPYQTAYIIRHSGARMIFCSTPAQLAKVMGEWHLLPELEAAILMEGEAPEGTGRRILTWRELQEAGARQEDQRPQVREWARERSSGNLLTLIYTSGTTGEPKGAMLTHGNLVSNILASLVILQLKPGRRCLSFLPLSHIFERMGGHYTMFYSGVSIYYVDDLNNLVPSFPEVRPHYLLAVPRIFEKIYAKVRESVASASAVKRMIFKFAMWVGRKVAIRRYVGQGPGLLLALPYRLADLAVFGKIRSRLGGRVELAASGGAALGPVLLEFFWAAGVPIFEGYGLSETSPVLTINARNEVRPGYVGRPILDEWQGRPCLKLSDDGEILCQGPNVTPGYWNDPFATGEAFDPEGYFRTGDIGALDERGRLKITDRKKELLVTSGGKNVAPQSIEKLLLLDKYIAQAVVVGDLRNFISAIIYPNMDSLRRWAGYKQLSYASDAELVALPQVMAKIMSRVKRANEQLSNYETVRKIVLTAEEMTLESGLLTPSLKIKRRMVYQKYAREIEDLYAGSN